MKLTHFSIFFIIIILPFSVICRNTMNEYFLTLKDQVRLNNVIDTATQDALETLVELNDEFQMLYINERFDVTQPLAKEAIKNFFQTMAINFNMPYIEEQTEAYFSVYVPAIVVIAYDGFYIYSVDETYNGYAYQISPKIPYAYEANDECIVNFTLGNYIKLYTNGKLYEGEITDDYYEDSEEKYKIYSDGFGGDKEALDYIDDITNDISTIIVALDKNNKPVPDFLISRSGDGDIPLKRDYVSDKEYNDSVINQEASDFHKKRRQVIIDLITKTLQEEINSHTTYAKLMGSTYSFALPDIKNEEWTNSINDISIMSFIQGMPIGVNSYYNNYALGASRIVETDYIYGTTDKHYHNKYCEKIKNFINGLEDEDELKVENIFVNRVIAAESGYYPCLECRP